VISLVSLLFDINFKVHGSVISYSSLSLSNADNFEYIFPLLPKESCPKVLVSLHDMFTSSIPYCFVNKTYLLFVSFSSHVLKL
jgi:hypothetical protein